MTLSPRFGEALAYAAGLHSNQHRKADGSPYVSHLLAVASIVLEHGADEDEAIAALLHDGPEDQGGRTTLDDIRQRFGERVAHIVAGCCDTMESPKPAWRPRKEAFIESMRTADPSVQRVVMADKLHNIRSIIRQYRLQGDAIWDYFREGREGSVWYHAAMVDALKEGHADPELLMQLETAVMDLEDLGRRVRNLDSSLVWYLGYP
jgi:(p)ppGpp synthase/HD superfamily hydrolase